MMKDAMSRDTMLVEQLGAVTAYDKDAAPVVLAELWRDTTAVIVFVRHFG